MRTHVTVVPSDRLITVDGTPLQFGARLAEYNSPEARAARVRAERDRRLAGCAWVIERHRDQLDNGEATTLTDEQYQAWQAYRQALRDLPEQPGFPWLGGEDDPSCPWPVEPVLPAKA